MYKKHLRRWETAALISLCISLWAGAWAQGQQEEISSRLLRLHVIAASDETKEQEIKLRVRDAVLDYLSPKLQEAESAKQAEKLITGELEGIVRAASNVSEGRKVTARLCRERYPTRDYGAIRLPAGEYSSLQLTLGEGEGHNWWCVVFPPVCLEYGSSRETEELMGEVNFALVTEAEGYELRFRAVELWGELMDLIK